MTLSCYLSQPHPKRHHVSLGYGWCVSTAEPSGDVEFRYGEDIWPLIAGNKAPPQYHSTVHSRSPAIGLLCIVALLGISGAAGVSLAAQQSPVNATPVDSCTTISEPGRYVLTQDIEDAEANVCIDIQSSDVHFDGNGHTVDGVQTNESLQASSEAVISLPPENVSVGVGIATAETLSNVTVSDVTVTDSFSGVAIDGVTDARVDGVTATNNDLGVLLNNSSSSVISNVTAIGNYGDGVLVDSLRGRIVSNNTISQTVARNNGNAGIAVWNASDSVVTESTAINNTEVGIRIQSETGELVVNNTVSDSTASQNGRGISVINAADSTVRNSTASNNTALNFSGIRFAAFDGLVAANNTVVDSTANNNGANGIAAVNAADMRIENNTVNGNVNGIRLDSSRDTVVRETSARANTNWTYYSSANARNNTVKELTIDEAVTVSFTGTDVALARSMQSQEAEPAGDLSLAGGELILTHTSQNASITDMNVSWTRSTNQIVSGT